MTYHFVTRMDQVSPDSRRGIGWPLPTGQPGNNMLAATYRGFAASYTAPGIWRRR